MKPKYKISGDLTAKINITFFIDFDKIILAVAFLLVEKEPITKKAIILKIKNIIREFGENYNISQTESISSEIEFKQIIRAIESITQKFIVCFHDEASGYAFKNTCGTWATLNYKFVHDIAKSYDKKGNFRQF